MPLVARISFVADYDGRQVAVHRDRTIVADDHELARWFASRFEPLPADDPHARSYSSRGVCRLANGEEWVPEHPPRWRRTG
jgi:hypothetical protein